MYKKKINTNYQFNNQYILYLRTAATFLEKFYIPDYDIKKSII